MVIVPSVGRVVWYFRSPHQGQPYAALVAYVHSDRCINIAWFDADGVAHSDTSVTLIQEGDMPTGISERYCTWMPFQLAQSRKAG